MWTFIWPLSDRDDAECYMLDSVMNLHYSVVVRITKCGPLMRYDLFNDLANVIMHAFCDKISIFVQFSVTFYIDIDTFFNCVYSPFKFDVLNLNCALLIVYTRIASCR